MTANYVNFMSVIVELTSIMIFAAGFFQTVLDPVGVFFFFSRNGMALIKSERAAAADATCCTVFAAGLDSHNHKKYNINIYFRSYHPIVKNR